MKVHLDEDVYDEGFGSLDKILKVDDNMIMVIVSTADKYVDASQGSFFGPDYRGVMLDFVRIPDNYFDDAEPGEWFWSEFRRSFIVIETDFKYNHVQIVPMKYEYHILIMEDPWGRDKQPLEESVDYEEIHWYAERDNYRRSAQIELPENESGSTDS